MDEDEIVAFLVDKFEADARAHGNIRVPVKIGAGIAPGTQPLGVWLRVEGDLRERLGPSYVVTMDGTLIARRVL